MILKKKKWLNIKLVILSKMFVWNICHSKNPARYDNKCIQVKVNQSHYRPGVAQRVPGT